MHAPEAVVAEISSVARRSWATGGGSSAFICGHNSCRAAVRSKCTVSGTLLPRLPSSVPLLLDDLTGMVAAMHLKCTWRAPPGVD